MIQATELRIGNWISDIHASEMGMWQVVELKDEKCKYGRSFVSPYENLRPIPLTPEILEKLGFERMDHKSQYIEWHTYSKAEFAFNSRTGWWCGKWKLDKQPQYLHQLQNLYYLLTGSELVTEALDENTIRVAAVRYQDKMLKEGGAAIEDHFLAGAMWLLKQQGNTMAHKEQGVQECDASKAK